ncbi:hypothetical protein SAMN06265365_11988 [Tistlia consotensis]|uniref:Uncharacterized protein n=1 Tax=Tistlia consotensis USBA 355 TaxID=560819 RepID=A0A1Y6CBN7_9PROT|nr:hypothetical protein [Tistlia consotensis]SMF55657.1 hypothetical protein SAMN05428998_12088 [Tistlia consotensis USBA 355]SNR88939.1 hypothetical protein SAMN06265365_11988 [Tistlia consotensis]
MPVDATRESDPRPPRTGDDLVAGARARNRTMALGVVAVVVTVFASAVLIGLWSHLLR